MLTFGALGGRTLQVHFGTLLIVFLQGLLGLLHVVLRLLHSLSRLPVHTFGVDLHLDEGVVQGRLRGLWLVSHLCMIKEFINQSMLESISFITYTGITQ